MSDDATAPITVVAVTATDNLPEVFVMQAGKIIGHGHVQPAPRPKTTTSPVGTTVTTIGPVITDGAGNTYGLESIGGRILLNGNLVHNSLDVISLQMTATGVQQVNGKGDIWTVASTDVPGNYVGHVASPAPAPPPTPAPAPVVPVVSTGTASVSLWAPPHYGAPAFAITDWAPLLGNLQSEGSATGLACKIPCPGGHLDWEYSNPEAEYYVNPAETWHDPASGQTVSYNPFTANADGSATIHAEPGSCPAAGQKVRSGCLATAGNQGTLFAGTYGFYACQLQWNLSAGFWPAYWMLSTDDNFAYTLELDFENWQNMIDNLHCGIANSGNGGTFFQAPDMANGHQLGWDYQPDFVTFYLDQKQVFQQPTPENCFGKHVFPIWNIAVGTDGSWAGQPPYAGTTMDMRIGQFAYFANA